MTDRGDSDITDGQHPATSGRAEPAPAAAAGARYYADEEDAGVPSPFVGPPDDDTTDPTVAAIPIEPSEDEPDLRPEPEAAPLAFAHASDPEPAALFSEPLTALPGAVEQSAASSNSFVAAAPHAEPASTPPLAAPPPILLSASFVPADPRDEASEADLPPSLAPDAWDLLAAEPEDGPAAALPLGVADEDDETESEPVVLDESSADQPAAPAATATATEAVGDGPAVEEVGDGPVTVTPAAPLTYETLEADAVAAVVAGRADRWTIPLLCAGICLIACCLLIPAADANRRLAYERQQLQLDLDSLRKQVEVNDRFLAKVAGDPNLAERLAQRQLKIVRAGTKVLQLPDVGGDEMSPYHLVAVTPPPPLPAYQPKGGLIARLCYNPRSRLYLIGVGMLMIAAGLVMGAQSKK